MILIPSVWGGDNFRHQDPDVLKDENPYWLNLYMFYELAYNSIVAEKFGDIGGWLSYAKEIYATRSLSDNLEGFSGLILSVSRDLNDTRSQIDVARKYLRQLNLGGASTAVNQALVHLRAANATVDQLDVSVKQIASKLKASPDPLLQEDQKIRELIARYMKMIETLRSDIRFYQITNGEQTNLMLTIDPASVVVGESVMVFGLLTDSSGSGLSSKDVSLYLADELIENIITLGDGSFSRFLKVPYIYRESLFVRADYRPSFEDLYSYLPSYAEVAINLIYFTPTLELSAPVFVYPGTDAEFIGSLSYSGVPIQGSFIRVIGLGGSIVALSGVDGGFREIISVPNDYPMGLALVVVKVEPRGVYGPVESVFSVNVVRVKSIVSASGDPWILSGSSFLVKGSVLAGSSPLNDCRVVVKGNFGEFASKTRVDGSYEVQCVIPVSVFTGNNDYSVYVFPVEPWVDSSFAELKVLVVNLYSIFAGVTLVAYGVYTLSKQAKVKPKKHVVVEPTVEAASYEISLAEPVELIHEYPQRSKILIAIAHIVGLTGLNFKPSSTIREYLFSVKDKLESDVYSTFRNLMLSYEHWLYGRPSDRSYSFLNKILDLFNRLLGK